MAQFEIIEKSFSQKQEYWTKYVEIACYFTGASEYLVLNDNDITMDRYLVRSRSEIVACFSIIQNTVTYVAYNKKEDRIDEELLEFLLDNWLKIIKQNNKEKTLKIRLVFPSCCKLQLEEKGFKSIYSRIRMTLSLASWVPPRADIDYLNIKEVSLNDLTSLVDVYLDAYAGTIDEKFFAPNGLKKEEETNYISTFLQNKNSEFPVIKNACVLAQTKKDILVGFCFICLWRDIPFVWELVVSKKYQEKGIGKYLLVHSLYKLRKAGYQQIALYVTEGNDRAQALYQSLGFKEDQCNLVAFEKSF
ncbi:MAG: GNAT family N-acetyltransferase [Candidatus Hermodarchaeota archaeon]